MKTNNILFVIIAIAASMLASCEQGGIEPKANSSNTTALTAEEMHYRDSVVAEMQSQAGLDNARRIVTISAVKTGCNTFKLTVNLNQTLCPGADSKQVVGYWTLFSTTGIQNLTPTYGDPCLDTGPQFSIDYSTPGVSYMYMVLLPLDPITRAANGPLLISNTIIVTPDC